MWLCGNEPTNDTVADVLVRSVTLIVKKQNVTKLYVEIYLRVLFASFQSIEMFTKSVDTLFTHSYTSVFEGREKCFGVCFELAGKM